MRAFGHHLQNHKLAVLRLAQAPRLDPCCCCCCCCCCTAVVLVLLREEGTELQKVSISFIRSKYDLVAHAGCRPTHLDVVPQSCTAHPKRRRGGGIAREYEIIQPCPSLHTVRHPLAHGTCPPTGAPLRYLRTRTRSYQLTQAEGDSLRVFREPLCHRSSRVQCRPASPTHPACCCLVSLFGPF